MQRPKDVSNENTGIVQNTEEVKKVEKVAPAAGDTPKVTQSSSTLKMRYPFPFFKVTTWGPKRAPHFETYPYIHIYIYIYIYIYVHSDESSGYVSLNTILCIYKRGRCICIYIYIDKNR